MKHDLMVVRDAITPGSWERTRLQAARGPAWYRRVLLHLARRLGLYAEAKWPDARIRTFERPSGPSFFHRLRLSSRDLEMVYNQRAKYLFVGPAQLDELLRDARAMSFGMMDLDVRGPTGWKVLGIEVVMIPWMEGCLLVPDWTQS